MAASIARQAQAPTMETFQPAEPFFRGCLGERQVCRVLGGLAFQGFRHVDDRRWPGSESANVDHVVVGPTGVFLIDSKFWSGRLEVVGTSLTQNSRPREQRLAGLVSLADAVDRHLVASGYGHLRCVPTICFSDAPLGVQPSLGRVMLTDLASLQDRLADRPPILTDDQAASIWSTLEAFLVEYAVDDELVDQALFALDEERDTGMSLALDRPMVDWAAWLHPEQKSLVVRSFNGPGRIRGAAGTGKTTIGLHRLARIAGTRPGKLLWVSYVKSLSPVMREAYRRISPETTDRVEFTHLHGLASSILRARDVRYKVDRVESSSAFQAAWKRSGSGLVLKETGLPQTYFAEEIEHVIKGRGLLSFEDYLSVQRVGRQTAFSPERRRLVWDLYLDYECELAEREVMDFVDPIRLALQQVERDPWEPYAAVVVDEVQDLPAIGIALLHRLVGDATDGLLILGDGQQQIYAGGWTLSDTSIDVVGRAAVLRHNHRNTVEVLARAASLLQSDEYDDLDGVRWTGDRGLEVIRHGAEPVEVVSASESDHDLALIEAVDDALATGCARGDLAVLLPTNALVIRTVALLKAAGIPALQLKDWDGTPRPAVLVGTYHRAKGLEFRHVFLPRLDHEAREVHEARRDELAHQEKQELVRRQMFVAMTRARDSLWLGRLSIGARTE
jgi:hypothetical protein